MILRYFGHSLFTMALENGKTLLTDPYGDFHAYPKQKLFADVVTISHHHHDHDAISMVSGNPLVIDQLGVYSPIQDVMISAVPSKHDDKEGALRGDNLIYVIEAEGLKIVHLGDVGHLLTERQRLAIGVPDVLLTPIGGYYTTDAQTAFENMRLLKPRVTIPMHYRTDFCADMPIQTEQPFFALLKQDPMLMPLCRITAGDISERPAVLQMLINAPAKA